MISQYDRYVEHKDYLHVATNIMAMTERDRTKTNDEWVKEIVRLAKLVKKEWEEGSE